MSGLSPGGPIVALSALEANTTARARAVAKKLLEEVLPVLNGLDIIYNTATTGAKFTITQANMDADPGLSGMTKAQLDDLLFALTGALRNDLTTSFAQLSQGAARA
jgi:hypothetical protein